MNPKLNFQDADAFYEQLLDAHAGLSREQSELLNARLILILSNQVGDSRVLQQCLDAAKLAAAAPAASGLKVTSKRPAP